MRDHLNAGRLGQILSTQHFDVVVLQELGGFPLCSPDFHGCADSPRALEEAVSLARNAGARPILFGTWQPNPALQPDLSNATREMAKNVNAEVADIGGAIYAIKSANTPMLDGSGHPSPAASWLAALVLVKTITMHAISVVPPTRVWEPDWTGTGPSENALASLQVQPPTKCSSLSKALFKELRRVANTS
jgi:sugar phosphate isomerase/epimerase